MKIKILLKILNEQWLYLFFFFFFQETFNQYFEHSLPPPHHDPVQGLLHSAYISIAQNAFKDAAEILQQAHKLNPTNGLVRHIFLPSNIHICMGQ